MWLDRHLHCWSFSNVIARTLCYTGIAFAALTLLVGSWPVKIKLWCLGVVWGLCCYTKISSFVASNPDWFYFSGTGLRRLFSKKAAKWVFICFMVCLCVCFVLTLSKQNKINNHFWPLFRWTTTTGVSPQLRMSGFVETKFAPACNSWCQLTHSHYWKDSGILLDSVTSPSLCCYFRLIGCSTFDVLDSRFIQTT